MNSLVGGEPRFRAVNLMSDEMREIREIIKRQVWAAGHVGTRAVPIPAEKHEQILEASIAEYNARVMARNALSSTSKQ